MDSRARVPHHGPAWILGGARLPQHGRPLARAALLLPGIGWRGPAPLTGRPPSGRIAPLLPADAPPAPYHDGGRALETEADSNGDRRALRRGPGWRVGDNSVARADLVDRHVESG